MKNFFYATLCIVSLCLSGCGYDDDEVWNAINDQEERIAALEEWQKTANENIAALQAIVNGNDYITSVEEIKEGDEIIGYTINFHRQGEVTIYNGKDGEKGDMPVIGVSEGEDGRWYWTVNGELLEDADGNPVCANGKDGEDGEDGEDGADGSSGSNGSSAPIPQVKTENGEVYLSVDGGATWHKISGSNTTSGDSFIESVVDNGAHYTFNFANEESIQVPKYTGLRLLYLEGNDEEGWSEKDILNGRVEATAGEDFTIQCYYLPEYTMSYKIVEGKDDWEIERIDFGEITDLRFKGVSEAEPTTIIFSLVAADNSATFYQVTLTVSEKEEEGEDTEQVAVIPETENSELVSLLENLGIGEKDAEGNLSLTQQDIDETTSLDLSNRKLNNLEGLEVFTNLTKLDCSNNQLTSIDLSELANLEELICSGNSLASLDFTGAPNIKILNCSECFGLVSRSRSFSNGGLDLTGLPYLEELYCDGNDLLQLNVRNNPELSIIECNDNSLMQLDVTSNEKLTQLNCYSNKLTTIDISHNPLLETLNLSNNMLAAIDLSANKLLKDLDVSGNSIERLDLSANTALTVLDCSFNRTFTSLDVSKLVDLSLLRCNDNSLLTLDVSKNTKLTRLYCGDQSSRYDNTDITLVLTISAEQQSLWDATWSTNSNVKLATGKANQTINGGSNFGNGGVY